MNLTGTDKKRVLKLAAKVIKSSICRTSYSGMPEEFEGGIMDQHLGVFVSIYIEGKLRGCIGTFSAEDTLGVNVRKMAHSAACSDSRFKSIGENEIDQMKVEISVLSERTRIGDPGEISVGKHGVYVESSAGHGTLLPQVAVKQNWSAEQFLGYCSKYKAGIGWDGWKSAKIYVYEAAVFSS